MHSLPHALLLGAQLWGEASTDGCWAEGAEAQLPGTWKLGAFQAEHQGPWPP